MKARMLLWWDVLRGSFWFIPSFMLLLAVVLGIVMPRLDARLEITELAGVRMSPSAARSTLSSITGAMVTSAGVVFSITIVALSIAASQFGSRLIRNFRNDRVTHFTLGAFIATSTYCLLVLASVRDLDGIGFVPHLSVYCGIVFAIGSLAMLIVFIHNTAISIQAPEVVRRSATDLEAAIERLFPDRIGRPLEASSADEDDRVEPSENPQYRGTLVSGCADGYVQAIDGDGLLQVASDNDLVVEILVRPGEFVTREMPAARIWSKELTEPEVQQEVSDCLIIGGDRTPRQDVAYAINELVEVAVRALSPGINDPFTAMACIDRLTAALTRLAGRRMPSPRRVDEEGRLRVMVRPLTFDDILHTALDQIRQHGRGDFTVTLRLIRGLQQVAWKLERPADEEAVRQHAALIHRESVEAFPDPFELDRIEAQLERLESIISDRESRPAQTESELERAKDPIDLA